MQDGGWRMGDGGGDGDQIQGWCIAGWCIEGSAGWLAGWRKQEGERLV